MTSENPMISEDPTTPGTRAPADDGAPAPRPQIRVVLWIVFLVYLGQMSLNPVIAPLAREVGLAEWQVGVTISVAAVMVVLCSQFWGRRSQSWGSRRVLGTVLSLAAVVMVAFTLVSWAGMRGSLGGGALFVLFVVLRGVGYGTAISAVAPTTQSYISGVTPPGPARVRGMAGVGAAQSTAMVIGSAAGGLLAGAGLLLPIALVPFELLVGLALIVSQSVIVPRSKWLPVRLLRVGTAIAACGFALMVPADGLWLLVVAVALIGIGLGIATPGFTSGPTMLMRRDEQGGLAGLLGAGSGLSYVFSPTASTALYGVSGLLPVLVGAAMMTVVWVFLLAHPRFRGPTAAD